MAVKQHLVSKLLFWVISILLTFPCPIFTFFWAQWLLHVQNMMMLKIPFQFVMGFHHTTTFSPSAQFYIQTYFLGLENPGNPL
jgi:hypothetical protein